MKKIIAVRVLPWEDENGKGWIVRKEYEDGTGEDISIEEYETSPSHLT